MTEIRPAADARPADWLSRAESQWWDLVRFGPPGFEVCLRIEFDDVDPPAPDTVSVALSTLASCTTTPGEAYAAIWEGWCAEPPPPAPRVEIPYRAMVLFTGPVESLRDAPEVAWHGPDSDSGSAPPHLAWPADRAWCLACEVDEEIEFTVGCSETTARVLEAALPGRVRREVYGAAAPMYLDD